MGSFVGSIPSHEDGLSCIVANDGMMSRYGTLDFFVLYIESLKDRSVVLCIPDLGYIQYNSVKMYILVVVDRMRGGEVFERPPKCYE